MDLKFGRDVNESESRLNLRRVFYVAPYSDDVLIQDLMDRYHI